MDLAFDGPERSTYSQSRVYDLQNRKGRHFLARKRIYEIAHELGVSSRDLIAKLEEMGMAGMKAANSVEEEEYSLIVHLYHEPAPAAAPAEPAPKEETPTAAAPVQPAADHVGAPRKPGAHGPRHGNGIASHGKVNVPGLPSQERVTYVAANEVGTGVAFGEQASDPLQQGGLFP